MTTTLSLHTTESDPEKGYDALKKAMRFIEDIRNIDGLRVVVHGDLQVDVIPVPPTEKALLIADIRRMLPFMEADHPELVAEIEGAMKMVEAES